MVRMTATPVVANIDFPFAAAQIEMSDDCPADAMGECLARAMQEARAQLGEPPLASLTFILQFETVF